MTLDAASQTARELCRRKAEVRWKPLSGRKTGFSDRWRRLSDEVPQKSSGFEQVRVGASQGRVKLAGAVGEIPVLRALHEDR